MRLYRHYRQIDDDARGAAVAIGNFDGVHEGHRAVIARAAEEARRLDVPLGVLTFEPHPRQFFRPDDPPFRLTPLRPKIRQFEALGVDLVYVLPFDRDLAAKPADMFVDDVLVRGLGVRQVVVGYDFVFGKGRGGDTGLLVAAGSRHGFGVTAIDPVASDEGDPHSSTLVRDLLRAGRPAQAARVLGRVWEVEGHVLPGDRRGRTIGFPTANLDLEGYLLPRFGVYAVRAAVDRADGGADWHDGVANLGLRPTVGDGKILLETHLFDFSGDIYGRLMRVQLIDFIRPERRFDGLPALQAQIGEDGRVARERLAAAGERGISTAPGCASSAQ